ncbi:MAG TPA: alkaline phosphatase [Bryobacteraceae bacterium]|nr:alkaline phosphatase [Bryobacteraceae bacterium]
MIQRHWLALGVVLTAATAAAQHLTILLPERTRLLQDQRVDLVIEVREAAAVEGLRVTANGTDITAAFGTPSRLDLDCNGTQDAVYRAPLYSFQNAGRVRLIATLGGANTIKDITVQPFAVPDRKKNFVLYIGDAMGTTYRDAARIVARSVETAPGVSGFREGYFDNLLEMDKMPVAGMAMTYASDRVVPDSANTASTWSSGNKMMYNAMGVFGDGTDCSWRGAGRNAATLSMMLDNPRLETVWEYLRRKAGYRIGIVTTADVTDATPAGQVAHTAHRETRAAIAQQYIEHPLLGNQPAVDVILGGGMEQFESDKRADQRNLIAEFQAKGYEYVTTASELRSANVRSGKLLGLFRRGNSASLHSSGIRANPDGNMNVAYDKLRLTRPASEPEPNFGGFEDQPFLDQMTSRAIEALAGPDGSEPFLLMVEAASIDKQSHPNHAAGTIWDTIELDKAIGVGRTWAAARRNPDTLLLVTADHDQSMHIIGVTEVSDADLTDRGTTWNMTVNSPVGTQGARVYKDSNTNVRAGYHYSNSGGDPNSSGREGPPAHGWGDISGTDAFPDYIDSNGDGYPENREANGKGKLRLSVGFRTGNHTGSSVPVTAEGPGALLFTGWYDQAEIALKMAAAIAMDTTELDTALRRMTTNSALPKTYGK